MAGLLSRGQAFLNKTLGKDAGLRLVYSRAGAAPVTLQDEGWVGRTVFAMVPEGQAGAATVFGERDYLIPVEALAIDGQRSEPKLGDRITETIGGVVTVFEVMVPKDAPKGEPPWRYSDASRTLYRVHCKVQSRQGGG